MGDKTQNTELQAILDAMSAFYANNGNISGSINDQEAELAIQSAIAEAIPQKYTDPDKAFTDDKIDWDALQAQRAYNYAIDQTTTNLRAKGLLR